MFGKINYLFGQNVNLKFQNTSSRGSEIKMEDSILLPVKSSYIPWQRTCQLVQIEWSYDRKRLKNQVWKTQNWCFGIINLHSNQKDNGFFQT